MPLCKQSRIYPFAVRVARRHIALAAPASCRCTNNSSLLIGGDSPTSVESIIHDIFMFTGVEGGEQRKAREGDGRKKEEENEKTEKCNENGGERETENVI